MNLKLQREIHLEYSRVLSACGLDEKSKIVLVVTAHSPPSRYRAVCYRSALLSVESKTESVKCQIDSSKLAGELSLYTELVLVKGSGTRKPFLAHLAGSRLYTETINFELEGSSSRMPVELTKFSEQLAWLGAPRAPWYISCGTADLHAPVMQVLRVYLNSEEPAFADIARRADPTLVSLLGADTARQILRSALNDDDFLAGSRDYDEGTLGEVAVRLLLVCFGTLRAADAKALSERDGSKFDAAIQSSMNVVENA